jgi:hypothetical protein
MNTWLREHHEQLRQALKPGCLVGVLRWDGSDIDPGLFLGWMAPDWLHQLLAHPDLDRWDPGTACEEDPAVALDREMRAASDDALDMEVLVLIDGQRPVVSVEDIVYPMPVEAKPDG